MKLKDITRDKRLLILGGSKTGKTRLLGTLCQVVPTLYITGDKDGLDTLEAMGVDPEILLIEDWRDIWKIWQSIQKLAPDFKALAVDDLGSIQRAARRKVETSGRGAAEERMAPADRLATIQRQLMQGDRRLQMQQWGELAISVETFLQALLGLSIPLKVVTVLEELREHPRSGAECLWPNLDGSIRYDLPAYFSLIGSTFVTADQNAASYWLTTRPHSRIPTGERYGAPRTWENPTMLRVLKHINRAEQPEDAETPRERATGVGI